MKKCEYCDDTRQVEMDNNGPIVDCPVCGEEATRIKAAAKELEENHIRIDGWEETVKALVLTAEKDTEKWSKEGRPGQLRAEYVAMTKHLKEAGEIAARFKKFR